MLIEWRDVRNYEGRYQVSSDGQVMSYVRAKPLLRKAILNRQGYAQVMLSLDGRQTLCTVHRLMAFAFLSDSWFPGAVVCHRDGNQKNNTIENLRWGTVRENNLDLIKHGRHNWQQGRDRNLLKTHCLRGHEFAGSNLRIRRSGARTCLACEAIRHRKSQLKKDLAQRQLREAM